MYSDYFMQNLDYLIKNRIMRGYIDIIKKWFLHNLTLVKNSLLGKDTFMRKQIVYIEATIN